MFYRVTIFRVTAAARGETSRKTRVVRYVRREQLAAHLMNATQDHGLVRINVERVSEAEYVRATHPEW